MAPNKVYKGRNPSPPPELENHDFLFCAHEFLYLKPSRSKAHKELPASINYIKEALLRCKLLEESKSKKHPEVERISKPLEVENDTNENSMDHVSSSKAELSDPSKIPAIVSHSKPITKIMHINKMKEEIETQKIVSDTGATEVSPVVEFSKALLKDNDLRNKLNAKKEESRELLKHCSRRNREDEYLSDDTGRNKRNEKKDNSSEHRMHKTLRRKRERNNLRGHELSRYIRSSRSELGDYSSDESEYSYKSYRRYKRSKSKDSVASKRRSNHKSSRRKSDSDVSDASVKIIASKIRRGATSKIKAEKDDFDVELLGAKVKKREGKELPKKRADSSDRRKVCPSPKPVQHNLAVSEDPYIDEDIEISAGVFGGSETFYCKVCQINLNGVACYETHMNGKKHKKALNAQILRPEALLYQVIGNHKKDPSFMQALNRNVKMTKSKEKSQLQTMVDSYHDNPIPDLKEVERGKCNTCDCKNFLKNLKDEEHTGWCIYCNHPPVAHEALKTEKELNSTSTLLPVTGNEMIFKKQVIPVLLISVSSRDVPMTPVMAITPINDATRNSTVAEPGPSLGDSEKDFPLPEFSKKLRPLLNGDFMSPKDHKKLSSILKRELIVFLNKEKLIEQASSSTALRYEYRRLGRTLAQKYPKMLWDPPGKTQVKNAKRKMPVYGTFIKLLSHRRKMQRLRNKKEKVEKIKKETDVATNISPEESVNEIKSVKSEAIANEGNT